MNKETAENLFQKVRFSESAMGCWKPVFTTRAVRHEGSLVSLAYLAYVLSDVEEPYRHKQEIVRICGNSDCFNPSHLLFREMERFWWYVNVRSEDDCWGWTKSIDGGGYGVFISSEYGREKTHRIAYMEKFGSIPNGLMVLHKCDNPACCNPSHLFLGNNKDNIDDKVSKNRQSRLLGSKNGRVILEKEDVVNMRNDYSSGKYSYRDLTKKYGVKQTQVARIIKRESWSWLG